MQKHRWQKFLPNLTERGSVQVGLTIIFFAALMVFCAFVRYSLLIPLLLVFFAIYLNFFKKAKLRLLWDLGLLLALIVFAGHIISRYTDIPYYHIPVAGMAMLTMLLFTDLQLAALMAFTASFVVTSTLGGSLEMMMIFFLGSMAGVFFIKGSRTRGQLIGAGLFVSFVNVLCLVLSNPHLDILISADFSRQQLYPLAANGFISAFLVVATLKVFEFFFGVLTNFSLSELADRNQPLLKRMALEAPGTWQHSLIVSQLAETAADEVGANGLLARVGAYYHDIGKLERSEYFTENQMFIGNKHDEIEPSMSRLVILNHVKEGIELARKYKLNQAIIDFIPQHHGTSLMYFFYQKALEEAKEGETVNENDFRYPGPKPQKRETAITLLADSVEGAVRSLDDPTPTKIAETTQKVVNNKFIDGQLDECNLTLKEINKISDVFIRILSAIYHGRVKYPEKENGNQHHKSSEKSSDQSRPNQENRSDHL